MESAGVDMIKKLYAAFGRGDIPAILDALSPDVTWAKLAAIRQGADIATRRLWG